MQKKTLVKEAISKTVEQSVNLLFQMREEMRSLTLKGGNYDVEDVMKSIMELPV